MLHGFKLTEEMEKEGFSGGTVQAGPQGQMFDVHKALVEGDGVIYTDDDIFAQVLAQYPALQRVPTNEVPKDAAPAALPFTPTTHAARQSAPWTPQSGDTLPQQRVEVVDTEITAEHADDPADVDQAVQQGEAVSDSVSEQDQPPQSGAQDRGSSSAASARSSRFDK